MRDPAIRRRTSKRRLIEEFFLANLGQPTSSSLLHQRFGSAVRTRISELNRRSDCAITIVNTTDLRADGTEVSTYTAERREPEGRTSLLLDPEDANGR